MKKESLQKARQTFRHELEVVSGLSSILDADFRKAVGLLSATEGKIVVSGIGKSGQIGMKISSTLTSLGIPSIYLDPVAAMHGDFGAIGLADAILALSSSGETKELLRAMKHVRRLRIPLVAVTSERGSSLARMSDAVIVFHFRAEGSPWNLAPMASTTASLVIGDMLAAALATERGFKKKDFANFHPGGSLGLRLAKVEELFDKKNVPNVKARAGYKEALRAMSNSKKGITAVVNDDGVLVGAVSDGDVRRFILSNKFSDKSLVRDLMVAKPKSINKKESLEDALLKMESHKISSLFVIDNKSKLEGIITMHDIVEYKIL